MLNHEISSYARVGLTRWIARGWSTLTMVTCSALISACVCRRWMVSLVGVISQF